MLFLADENIPKASITALRASGHDVFAIAEASPGLADQHVLQLSAEAGRILLTFDRDFGALVFRGSGGGNSGVVLFRFIPLSPEEPAQLLLAMIAEARISFTDRFTVVDRDRIRQRGLPPSDDTESTTDA